MTKKSTVAAMSDCSEIQSYTELTLEWSFFLIVSVEAYRARFLHVILYLRIERLMTPLAAAGRTKVMRERRPMGDAR